MLIASYSLLALIVLLGSLLAIRAKNLIVAASVLGLGSAALAMMLFMLDAPYAAGFELSVGAGLVSVLFIVAISLTMTVGQTNPFSRWRWGKSRKGRHTVTPHAHIERLTLKLGNTVTNGHKHLWFSLEQAHSN